jgi:hypothetical protein
MSWQVTTSNSRQFTIDGDKYALACVFDEDFERYYFGIFKLQGGAWIQVAPIKMAFSDSEIMQHGSVAGFIQAMLPVASEKIKALALPVKPDQLKKGACVGYDLAMDVAFDPATMTFALNKQPPLSHAR